MVAGFSPSPYRSRNRKPFCMGRSHERTYSARSASVGFMRVALNAGSQLATRPMTASSRIAAVNIRGSSWACLDKVDTNSGYDYFKLKGLTFDVPRYVPATGSTFMLLGAGLLVAAILRRR